MRTVFASRNARRFFLFIFLPPISRIAATSSTPKITLVSPNLQKFIHNDSVICRLVLPAGRFVVDYEILTSPASEFLVVDRIRIARQHDLALALLDHGQQFPVISLSVISCL